MNDTGNIILKGDVPTEAEFARLLCDKTFVDYFNTFLSLPVFAQRLLYRYREQTFELDPPLQQTKYRLDRVKLMRWVRTQRAPLFFKTDLYLDYLLCRALLKTQLQMHTNLNDSISAKDRILDHRLMSRWLGRVSGMNRFRQFLTKTTGERSLAFWLDAERFHKLAKDNDEEHRKFFRQMEAKYFKYGASMELPEHAKWPAFCTGLESRPEPALSLDSQRQRRHSYFVGGGVQVETRLPGGSLFGVKHGNLIDRNVFVVIQGFILKTLQNYWVPRFIIHCKTRWSRDGPMLQRINIHDINAFSPNWYAVRVRSLSELASEDIVDNEGADAIGKSSHVLSVCKKLKKQSMSNLMAMFSSRGMRHSELNAMLKTEDTGERVGSVTEEDDDGNWLFEEFPLATISEESHISSQRSSRKSSPVTQTPRITPVTSGHDTLEPQKPGSTRRIHSGRKPSRSRSKASTTKPKSPLAREEVSEPEVILELGLNSSEQKEEKPGDVSSTFFGQDEGDLGSFREQAEDSSQPLTQESSLTEKKSDQPSDEDKEIHDETSGDEPLEKKTSSVKITSEAENGFQGLSTELDSEGVPIDDDKGQHPPLNIQGRRRRSSITPVSMTHTSSNSSMTHGSHSSMSLTGSRRRMSLPAAGSTGGLSTKAPKPKPPPQRRQRSMSVEFRLADFSMLMTTLDSSGKEDDKMLPQLEADLLALESQKEQDEKKQLEEKNKKKKKSWKRKKFHAKSEDGSLSKSSVSRTRGKGRMAQTRRGGKLVSTGKCVKLTQSNLAKFDAQQSGSSWLHSPLHNVFHDIIQPDRISKSMSTSLRKKREEFEKKDYAKLSFVQKLEHDDFKLSTLPHVSSPIPPAEIESHVPSISTASSKKSASVDLKLPQISSKPAMLAPSTSLGICKPSYRGYNLGEPNYRHRHRQLVGAVAADKLAGGPFEKYLSRQGRLTNVSYIRFWQATQEYLTTGTYSSDLEGNFLCQRQAQNIIATFLTQTGDRFVSLGDGLTEELKKQLPANSGDELLTHAQDLACEAVRESWEAYQKHDRDEFLTRTTSRKPFGDILARSKCKSYAFPSGLLAKELPPLESSDHRIQLAVNNARQLEGKFGDKVSKNTAIEETNSMAPYRIWMALHLAQCTSRLNSDTATELSDPSDPESDSDDEGSLRRKSIVVVRKRKAKPQIDIIRTWTPSLEMQRIKHEREIVAPSAKERDSPTFEAVVKAVCKAIRKDGKTIHRPPRPRTFQEVLRDTSHFEFFKRFLTREKAETPLLFWQAVENMRTTCRDAKSRQSKTIMIIRKFFCKATDFGGTLQCDSDIIMDIPNMEKVTPQMLLSAQACVARSMEDRWFAIYQDTFPEESPVKEVLAASKSQIRIVPREKNKALWGMFIHNVISFRRGLMNHVSLGLFKSFLRQEVQKEIEKQKQTGTQSKRMISNKVIIVDRLGNDLGFWAEVERFKDLADSAAAAAAAGTYTLEDEEYVQQKAKAIIDCYIDSQVPPKVQINVTQELADEILDTAQNGLIERGLFHDAAVNTFTVLLYCWKKFCRERFAPPPIKISKTPTIKPKRKKKRKKAPSTPLVCGVKIKTIVGQHEDEPPRMQFSLQHGIQLVLPPKPPQIDEEMQREHIKRLMRQLYPHVGDVYRNGDEKLIQMYHQLVGQHGTQGVQSLLQQQRRFSHFKTQGNMTVPLARHFNPQAS